MHQKTKQNKKFLIIFFIIIIEEVRGRKETLSREHS